MILFSNIQVQITADQRERGDERDYIRSNLGMIDKQIEYGLEGSVVDPIGDKARFHGGQNGLFVNGEVGGGEIVNALGNIVIN